MYVYEIIYDLIKLTTINLPLDQLHGLIFIIIPFNICLKQNISLTNNIMIMKYIISLISCFNFELLNVISGINNKTNDIRENNIFINKKYYLTFTLAVLIQLIIAFIINLYEENIYIYLLISIIYYYMVIYYSKLVIGSNF